MPAGKRTLKQLFTTGMQIGTVDTTAYSSQLLTGSVGFATAACDGADVSVHSTCGVVEVAITNLGACDVIVGNVYGMSGCLMYNHEIRAGDGQASIVLRYAGSGQVVTARTGTTGGTLRYIAFSIVP